MLVNCRSFNPRDNGADNQDNHISNLEQIRSAAFDASPAAQVVVDVNGLLILANERCCTQFNLSSRDIGRPLQEVELSYRPLELRSRIEQVYQERRNAIQNEVEWTSPSGESLYFDIKIAPLFGLSSKLLGVSISFTDATREIKLPEELEHSNQELEFVSQELRLTNEELETSNEELQLTNEELETMNEELQSSNEELQTINKEMRLSGEELYKVNFFLESILGSLCGAVVVVNPSLQILVWNSKAEDLWGLRATEVLGQHFFNLDIGLPVENLRQPLRTCITEEPQVIEVTLQATNCRGKSILCKVTCTSLIGRRNSIQGAIVLMEQVAEG
ncbi:MAG TPA: PAS domain-containing protein [Leptolyngbyaceae cyanobacterium]